MRRTARQLRDITNKANLQKRHRKNELSADKIKEAQREASPVLKRVFQEIEQASRRGEYRVCIPAIRVGIHTLSEIAFQIILQDLRQKKFRVEVNRETSCDILELEMPANHDIDGWEEYQAELDKHTKHFIQDIVVGW